MERKGPSQKRGIRATPPGGRSCRSDWGFNDENFILRHVGPGCLSTCNRGPDTNDSRFFLTLGKAQYLDEKSIVFGYVLSGWEVVKEIEKFGTPHTGEPKKLVKVEDCGECTPWTAIKAGAVGVRI